MGCRPPFAEPPAMQKALLLLYMQCMMTQCSFVIRSVKIETKFIEKEKQRNIKESECENLQTWGTLA